MLQLLWFFFFYIYKGIFKALKQKTKELDTTTNTETDSCLTQPNKANPFLQENEGQTYSKLDVAMDALTAFTVKRNLSKLWKDL